MLQGSIHYVKALQEDIPLDLLPSPPLPSQVVGDDTLALQSVLECDTEREELLRREQQLLLQMPGNGGWVDDALATCTHRMGPITAE